MSGLLKNPSVVRLQAADSPSIDAFDRWRVSEPHTLFDSSIQYHDHSLFWETRRTGGGTYEFLSDQAAVWMKTTGANGDKVERQTYDYYRYQPGKSQLVLLTFLFGPCYANCRKRVGYFDRHNGIFLEAIAGVLYFVRRSSASGTPSDAVRVSQSEWNLDRLDGTGPSGKTLDASKVQILVMDLEWLGVGRVRIGFVLDGIIYYAHQFTQANIGTGVYMSTASLPLRYEIENTGATTASWLLAICGAVMSEGGFQDNGALQFAGGTGATSRSINTRQGIVGIRPKTVYGSAGTLTNRVRIKMEAADILATNNTSLYWELVYNPSVTGGTWVSASGSSAVEINTAGSTVTGGHAVAAGYLPSAVNTRTTITAGVRQHLPITVDMYGTNPQSMWLVGTGIGGASAVAATLTWTEIQ